ncbi:DUF6879 family protein [Phytomonospora sp. NPDC050363]|uniref:DUF6879 family protein n=1 Tax=Phytomonospora sp. NPDC050363 TaxID=3155642 RepID=UPI0034028884
MDVPEPPRKHKSTILRKVLVTAVIGALGFGLTELILQNGESSWMASIFLGSAAFVTQFLVDVERRLDSVEFTYRTEAVNSHQIMRAEFAKINEASGLYERMENGALPIETIVHLIRSTTQIEKSVPGLVYRLAVVEVHRLITFLDEINHNKDTTYEGEDRDWLLALTESSRSSINAISLHTVDVGGRHFLLSDLGRRYISEQAKAIGRGVHIRRIHVLDPQNPDEDTLHEICQRQLDVGIEVRILNPARHDALIDFVLFDQVMSYETTPASQQTGDESPVIVNTRLLLKPERVGKRIEMFNALWEAAVPIRREIAGPTAA